MLLEVLDGRRAVAHLEPLVASKVLETVAGLCRVGVRRRDPAAAATTIRRVHVQMLGPAVAEVFGSYTRDDRTLAFAGRIERVPRRVRSGVTGRAGAAGSGSPSPGFARTGFAGGLAKVEYRWQLVELDLC